MDNKLGKISKASFGIGAYNDTMLGLHLELSFNGGSSGTMTSHSILDFNRVEHTEHTKWTEEDRAQQAVEVLKHLSATLKYAKVNTVEQLVGIPIRGHFDGNTLRSWSVLTEVL